MRRLAALLFLLLSATAARAEDAISFGLDWVAEAEYGGYYQALATGIYAKHGLKVTIRQGGPQVNQMQLMMAGRLDFNLGGGRAIEFVQQNLPFVAIAAMFQKDPSVLIAHPGQGNDSFAALKGKPILIGADTRAGWWRFLAAQVSATPMRRSAPTRSTCSRSWPTRRWCSRAISAPSRSPSSRPRTSSRSCCCSPMPATPATPTSSPPATKLVTEKPDVVQRFIDASIEGWYSYLYGDPTPANKLIKQDNPEMTDALLNYGRDVMKTQGIVDSGDALKLGIGAMTDARWAEFYRSMSDVGVYPKGHRRDEGLHAAVRRQARRHGHEEIVAQVLSSRGSDAPPLIAVARSLRLQLRRRLRDVSLRIARR